MHVWIVIQKINDYIEVAKVFDSKIKAYNYISVYNDENIEYILDEGDIE